jgi:hypothetical protein
MRRTPHLARDCSGCKFQRRGGRLQLVGPIEEPSVIERILKHLGLAAELPATRPGRPPPCLDESASA